MAASGAIRRASRMASSGPVPLEASTTASIDGSVSALVTSSIRDTTKPSSSTIAAASSSVRPTSSHRDRFGDHSLRPPPAPPGTGAGASSHGHGATATEPQREQHSRSAPAAGAARRLGDDDFRPHPLHRRLRPCPRRGRGVSFSDRRAGGRSHRGAVVFAAQRRRGRGSRSCPDPDDAGTDPYRRAPAPSAPATTSCSGRTREPDCPPSEQTHFGDNSDIGGTSRADTIMLVHTDPNLQKAIVAVVPARSLGRHPRPRDEQDQHRVRRWA